MTPDSIQVPLPRDVTWSVDVRVRAAPRPLVQVDPHRVCATASIGKILLLIAAAEAFGDGVLDPAATADRTLQEPVADSGLWQHLHSDRVPLVDLCALVGATSDNLATNALISVVGLPSVTAVAERLGLIHTRLHDAVRDVRPPGVPPQLSSGSAAELRLLCDELDSATQIATTTAAEVVTWLSTNCDLSMVASAFGLDPLAHTQSDRGMRLWNKTGTNDGVRCDVGIVRIESATASYAVLANWQPAGPHDPIRDQVLAAMRGIGDAIRITLQRRSAP
jgi:beta-lactamase class A